MNKSLLTCAACSFVSYDPAGVGDKSLPQECKEFLTLCQISEIAPGLSSFTLDDELILAFRGTDRLSDLVRDVEICEQPCTEFMRPGVLVHGGFLATYESQRRQARETVMKFRKAEIIITGHSSGGALATLCAYDLAETLPSVSAVTFGSPAVGNAAFVTEFANRVAKSVRVAHILDPVPSLFPLFPHVSELLLVQGKGSWSHWIKRIFRILDFHYHSLYCYIRCLKEMRCLV
jgi:pimeloyl-ACP methyl ester carboxylesterase